jgi:type II secretory pathway component PulK
MMPLRYFKVEPMDAGPRRRRGVVLIAALATLAIASALIAVGVGMSLRSRQSRKTERDRIQLELLCDAGLRRTAQRLQQDPSYAGEAWLQLEGLYPETRMRVLIEPGPALSTDGIPAPSRTFTIRAILEGRSHSPETMQRSRTHTFFTSAN